MFNPLLLSLRENFELNVFGISHFTAHCEVKKMSDL